MFGQLFAFSLRHTMVAIRNLASFDDTDREARATLDTIYLLTHLVGEQVEKRRGREAIDVQVDPPLCDLRALCGEFSWPEKRVQP
jgi:hypothetical protein